MDLKRKEEILNELDKEEKLCKEIYEEILRNRIKYEEEIRILKIETKIFELQNSKNLNISKKKIEKDNKENNIKTKETGVSPIKVICNSDSIYTSKNSWNQISKSSPKNAMISKGEGKREMRIPLGSIHGSHNFDAISSRKNPLDSLRNTSDRNEMLSSFDSLQYSEDISFL